MSSDSRYPDVPIDADGMDAIVRELSRMDRDHRTKAVGLLMCARTEYAYALSDGDLPGDPTFSEFVEAVEERLEDFDFEAARASMEADNE